MVLKHDWKYRAGLALFESIDETEFCQAYNTDLCPCSAVRQGMN